VRRRVEADRVRLPGIRRQMLDEGLIVMGAPEFRRDLEAGRPVELNALMLPPMFERHVELGLEGFDRVRIDPDDTITVVGLQKPAGWDWDDEDLWEEEPRATSWHDE
jgi:hypothetical protein